MLDITIGKVQSAVRRLAPGQLEAIFFTAVALLFLSGWLL